MCQLFLTIRTEMMLSCYMTLFGIMYERSSKVIMVSYSKNDRNGQTLVALLLKTLLLLNVVILNFSIVILLT